MVCEGTTLNMAKMYGMMDKVAVLNFANPVNPGGGVTVGAMAQEECLCRSSNLYKCISHQNVYGEYYAYHQRRGDHLYSDRLIYTENVVVFKNDDPVPSLLPKKQWFQVDVITCAAPNLRSKPSNKYNSGDGDKSVSISDKNLLELHKKRLRRMLDVIVLEGAENVILGAFGCGAFMNKPEVVARAAKEVIVDYMYAFKNIEFAVYCGRDMNNYTVFERAFKSLKNKS